MDGCESWSIKKAESRGIDAFGLWCWRRLLRVPWTARRSNQSILKEISPEYSLEELSWSWNSSTLATWHEQLTHWKRSWCWGRLKARGEVKTEDEMVGWHHRFNGHEFEQAPGVGDEQGSMACCSPWVAKSRTRLSNWTELKADTVHEEKLLYISLFLKTTLFTSYFNTYPQSMLHRNVQ